MVSEALFINLLSIAGKSMVWRMFLFQPQYNPVQKWQEVFRGINPAQKKKTVIAIGRQLIVDLWRLQNGRGTAQETRPGDDRRLRSLKVRRTAAHEIGALPQTPVWGEQFNGQSLWARQIFVGGRKPTVTKGF
jgi:hypothetical protein